MKKRLVPALLSVLALSVFIIYPLICELLTISDVAGVYRWLFSVESVTYAGWFSTYTIYHLPTVVPVAVLVWLVRRIVAFAQGER